MQSVMTFEWKIRDEKITVYRHITQGEQHTVDLFETMKNTQANRDYCHDNYGD